MLSHRVFRLLCPIVLAFACSPADAAIFQQDVIAASRLRMQVQRLAKLHYQGRVGVHAERSRQELQRGVPSVEAALGTLAKSAEKERTRRIVDRTRLKWEGFRELLLASPKDANLVHLASEDLENTLSALVLALEGDAADALGPYISLSLRQAMLSQRIAKLYLLQSLGDRSHSTVVDIGQTRLEFQGAMKELAQAPENTQRTREELELARVQWLFYEKALDDRSSKEPSYRQNVATTSDRISQVMEEIVVQLLPQKALVAPRKRAGRDSS